MIFMKVQFTEWRDAPPVNQRARPVSEADAANQKLAALTAREFEVRADIAHAEALLKLASSAPLRARLAGHVVEMDNLYVARKAALAAQSAAGQAEDDALKAHARVGGFGYQVIDEAARTMLKLVDADGADLPAGAVYSYEIVDQAPMLPAWTELIKVSA